MTKTQILLLIAAFLTLTLGSFVWYIVTWDARKGANVSESAAHQLHFAITIPAGGSTTAPGAALAKDSTA